MPDEYYGPDLPEGCETTWYIFHELNMGRQYQSTLSYESIRAYCEMTGQRLYWWQLEAIKRLDVLFMARLNNHG